MAACTQIEAQAILQFADILRRGQLKLKASKMRGHLNVQVMPADGGGASTALTVSVPLQQQGLLPQYQLLCYHVPTSAIVCYRRLTRGCRELEVSMPLEDGLEIADVKCCLLSNYAGIDSFQHPVSVKEAMSPEKAQRAQPAQSKQTAPQERAVPRTASSKPSRQNSNSSQSAGQGLSVEGANPGRDGILRAIPRDGGVPNEAPAPPAGSNRLQPPQPKESQAKVKANYGNTLDKFVESNISPWKQQAQPVANQASAIQGSARNNLTVANLSNGISHGNDRGGASSAPYREMNDSGDTSSVLSTSKLPPQLAAALQRFRHVDDLQQAQGQQRAWPNAPTAQMSRSAAVARRATNDQQSSCEEGTTLEHRAVEARGGVNDLQQQQQQQYGNKNISVKHELNSASPYHTTLNSTTSKSRGRGKSTAGNHVGVTGSTTRNTSPTGELSMLRNKAVELQLDAMPLKRLRSNYPIKSEPAQSSTGIGFGYCEQQYEGDQGEHLQLQYENNHNPQYQQHQYQQRQSYLDQELAGSQWTPADCRPQHYSQVQQPYQQYLLTPAETPGDYYSSREEAVEPRGWHQLPNNLSAEARWMKQHQQQHPQHELERLREQDGACDGGGKFFGTYAPSSEQLGSLRGPRGSAVNVTPQQQQQRQLFNSESVKTPSSIRNRLPLSTMVSGRASSIGSGLSKAGNVVSATLGRGAYRGNGNGEGSGEGSDGSVPHRVLAWSPEQEGRDRKNSGDKPAASPAGVEPGEGTNAGPRVGVSTDLSDASSYIACCAPQLLERDSNGHGKVKGNGWGGSAGEMSERQQQSEPKGKNGRPNTLLKASCAAEPSDLDIDDIFF